MSAAGLQRPSRRRFLAGTGALVVYFALRPAAVRAQAPQPAPTAPQPVPGGAPPLPGSLKTAPFLDSWIRIDAEGNVTVFTGRPNWDRASRRR